MTNLKNIIQTVFRNVSLRSIDSEFVGVFFPCQGPPGEPGDRGQPGMPGEMVSTQSSVRIVSTFDLVIHPHSKYRNMSGRFLRCFKPQI